MTHAPELLRGLASCQGLALPRVDYVDGLERDLTRLRIEAGSSAVDLAKRTKVALSTLNRWESGTVRSLASRAPTDDLTRALGVDIDVVRKARSSPD